MEGFWCVAEWLVQAEGLGGFTRRRKDAKAFLTEFKNQKSKGCSKGRMSLLVAVFLRRKAGRSFFTVVHFLLNVGFYPLSRLVVIMFLMLSLFQCCYSDEEESEAACFKKR